MRFKIPRTWITAFLVVLGVVVLSVAIWCNPISAQEGQENAENFPVPVEQAGEGDAVQPAAAGPVSVLEINVTDEDGSTRVEIILSGNASSSNSFFLSDPLRLVVDIEGAFLTSRPDPIPVGDGIINQVRVGQFNPTVVRIVFDLERVASYTIVQTEDKPDVLTICFPKRVTGVNFFDRDGRAEVVIFGEGELEFETLSLLDPPRIVVDLPGAVLASDATEIPVSHAQVSSVRASQFEPDKVRVVVDLAKPSTYSVYTSSKRPGEIIVNLGCRILGASFVVNEKSTIVDVMTTGDPEVEYMLLSSPTRLVMDFQNSILDTTEREIPVGDGVVERIRLAQHSPMTVRVVLDLNYYTGHLAAVDSAEKKARVEVYRSSVANKVIAIDPGHGGVDPGAIGPTGLKEKDVVLDIAKRVAAELEAKGARVVMTRSEDVTVALPDRVQIAQDAGADAFVSIHANAARNRDSTGTETLYSGTMTLSRVLAESVQAALVNRIQQVDRGARERNDLLVIREAQCPACLVEVVFMSNYTEELMLLDPAFRQKAAEGIAAGVMSFFGFHEAREAEVGDTAQTGDDVAEDAGEEGQGTEALTLPVQEDIGPEESEPVGELPYADHPWFKNYSRLGEPVAGIV